MSYVKVDKERKNVNTKLLIILSISVVLFVAVTLLLLNEYFLYERESIVYDEMSKPRSSSLLKLNAKEDDVLSSYKLLDSTKGTYSIPIDSAIELYIQESSNL